MAQIVWSNHAEEQLRERGISKRVVLSAFRKPDSLIRQTAKRWRAIKLIHRNGKRYLLVIVYDQTNNTREIVTAFLTSKIDKYI